MLLGQTTYNCIAVIINKFAVYINGKSKYRLRKPLELQSEPIRLCSEGLVRKETKKLQCTYMKEEIALKIRHLAT